MEKLFVNSHLVLSIFRLEWGVLDDHFDAFTILMSKEKWSGSKYYNICYSGENPEQRCWIFFFIRIKKKKNLISDKKKEEIPLLLFDKNECLKI